MKKLITRSVFRNSITRSAVTTLTLELATLPPILSSGIL
jgi:hypothetical protein